MQLFARRVPLSGHAPFSFPASSRNNRAAHWFIDCSVSSSALHLRASALSPS